MQTKFSSWHSDICLDWILIPSQSTKGAHVKVYWKFKNKISALDKFFFSIMRELLFNTYTYFNAITKFYLNFSGMIKWKISVVFHLQLLYHPFNSIILFCLISRRITPFSCKCKIWSFLAKYRSKCIYMHKRKFRIA